MNLPIQQYKQRFLVKIGIRMYFVDTKDISYFYADDKNVFLINIEGIRFPVDYTLEKLQELLDPQQFFRLNRKIVCGIWAIKEIKVYLNSRLKVFLQAGKNTDEAVVSRERVSAFKAWAES